MSEHTFPSHLVDEETLKEIQSFNRRTQSRVVAFQIICEEDSNPKALGDQGEVAQQLDRQMIEESLETPDQIKFAASLLRGIRLHKDEIDAEIANFAKNWSMTRMELTDRNVLRLGIYELLFTDTPAPIVINESVEIAKAFGTENSGTFVNGILDRIAKAPKISKESEAKE